MVFSNLSIFIEGTIIVLKISQQKLVYVCFVRIAIDITEAIHHYISHVIEYDPRDIEHNKSNHDDFIGIGKQESEFYDAKYDRVS